MTRNITIPLTTWLLLANSNCEAKKPATRPNILFAISDDQSFVHTSFSGCRFVNTPAFDRIAKEGVCFTNCYAGSPGSAPSRSAIITGRYPWQNEQSGQHASSWMKKYVPFTDLLDRNGYYTGRTGKGVAPFQYARNEMDSLWRKEDAAGIEYSQISYKPGTATDERTGKGIGAINYFENFKYFIEHRKDGKPFFFWYGATEPHRAYEEGSWKRQGKKLTEAVVPGFLPDNEIIRGDLLDYVVEIEWFDLHLQRMLEYLEKIGELENTIVIVTADNGMPFPRAKALSYEYGVHVPLAIRFPENFPGGRIVDDPISFTDLAPTILDLTGTDRKGMLPISGRSIVNILKSKKEGIVDQTKKYVFAGRERHSSSRWNNLGYPQRIIRDKQHLYIWNIRYERWPAGDPQASKPDSDGELLPMYGIDEKGKHHSDWAFTDVDESPSKAFLVENFQDKNIFPFFQMSFALRPEFELYDVVNDPLCLKNIAGNHSFQQIEQTLKSELMKELTVTKDPRVVGPDPEIFDSYLRYSPIREFPKPNLVK